MALASRLLDRKQLRTHGPGDRSSGAYHRDTPWYDRFTWERADRFAIDMGGGAWNAGHVNALVAAGEDLLVGSDTGGVWLATGDDASPVWVPVSDDWSNPDVQCL